MRIALPLQNMGLKYSSQQIQLHGTAFKISWGNPSKIEAGIKQHSQLNGVLISHAREIFI
jgi:hypothetical protein